METEINSPTRTHRRIHREGEKRETLTPPSVEDLPSDLASPLHKRHQGKINKGFFSGRKKLPNFGDEIGVEILMPKKLSLPKHLEDESFIDIRVPKKNNIEVPLETIEPTDSNINSESENDLP